MKSRELEFTAPAPFKGTQALTIAEYTVVFIPQKLTSAGNTGLWGEWLETRGAVGLGSQAGKPVVISEGERKPEKQPLRAQQRESSYIIGG